MADVRGATGLDLHIRRYGAARIPATPEGRERPEPQWLDEQERE
jgi:hypothetical protein